MLPQPPRIDDPWLPQGQSNYRVIVALMIAAVELVLLGTGWRFSVESNTPPAQITIPRTERASNRSTA